MAVVIVVNPVYIRQDPWTTSCCSPVELTCRRCVKGAIPRGRVRFPPVTWVLSNCQRSFLQRVLQLQRPWVILPMCTWRPSELSQLSQAHAGREDVVSSMGLCLQTRGDGNGKQVPAGRTCWSSIPTWMEKLGRLLHICSVVCYGLIAAVLTKVRLFLNNFEPWDWGLGFCPASIFFFFNLTYIRFEIPGTSSIQFDIMIFWLSLSCTTADKVNALCSGLQRVPTFHPVACPSPYWGLNLECPAC